MRSLFRWSLVVSVVVASVVSACTTEVVPAPAKRKKTTTSAASPSDTTDDDDSADPNADPTGSGSSSSGSATPDGGSVTPPPAGAGLPCDIAAFLAAKCTSCHADPPINGSLAGLVTVSDLLATSKEDATKNEAQLSLARMMNSASPMPPTSVANPATPAEISAFQSWINGGYKGSCDGGAPPPPTGVDPFAGAGNFTAQSGGSGKHNAGKDCMGGCHNHGFTFAGTLYNAAGQAVPNAEVRLVDANGKAISVYSGTNGNFYSSQSWKAPAHVGARDATNKVVMATPLSAGGCNGCHATGGTTSKIHLP